MEEEIKVTEELSEEEDISVDTDETVQEADEAAGTAAEETQEAAVEPELPEEEEDESIGNIKISVEVVSTIAGIAASEIEGVSCMYTSFAQGVAKRLGARRNASTGVRVDMSTDSVSIDLYLVVEYGVKIPELAWNIQENVKTNVETMTGLPVSKVNIHIEGISFEKDENLPEEEAAEEITE